MTTWMTWVYAAVSSLLVVAQQTQPLHIADPDQMPVRPYRELAYSQADIAAVRRAALAGVNRRAVDEVFKVAARWLAYSEQEVIDLIPPPDAAFAYGFAGDSKTDQNWPWFGRDGVCSLDRPGEVRSPHTGDIYGIQKPGEEFYDPGDGWVRPSDGKRFYFKGVWHEYMDRLLHEVIYQLALAYMLTGDEAIAQRCLFILDRLAYCRTQRPAIDGAIDWPHDLKPGQGYFGLVGNLANDRTAFAGLALDLLANARYAGDPSPSLAGVTVFENIRDNFFDVYEPENIAGKNSLQNHALMVIANTTVQGLLFGKADYIATGIDGTCAFLEGTIDRDGDYYELAGGYGNLGRVYAGLPIGLLTRYDPQRYDNPSALPDPADYPYQLDFGQDPRWYVHGAEMTLRQPVLGRYPPYGDDKPDRDVLLDKTASNLAAMRSGFLRQLYQQVSNPQWKRRIAAMYWLTSADLDVEYEAKDLLAKGVSVWIAPPRPESEAALEEVRPHSELRAAKVIAVLRSGAGEHGRALFVRGGSCGSHAHDNQMAIVPYGHGMVLDGTYGYNLYGTTDHLGWGVRAINHLTATVNEDLPAPYIYKGVNDEIPGPPSDVIGLVTEGPAQCVELRNVGMWKAAADDMRDYRRLTWLIDIDDQQYYFADIFHIEGGRVHDYAWKASYDEHEDDRTFQVVGVQPQAQEGVWTLAALSGEHREAAWNKPKQSWGERLFSGDGNVRDVGLNDLPEKMYRWNPEPGNGYGMIWDIRSQCTDSDWSAVWKLQDNQHFLRCDLLNFDGMTAVAGRAPSLEAGKPFNIIIARRAQPQASDAPLRSRFVNITQVGKDGDWPLQSAQRVDFKASGDARDAAVLRVELPDGRNDYLLSSRKSQQLSCEAVSMSGCRGFARLDADGKLVHLALQEGTSIEAGGWRVQAESDALEARVLKAEADWVQSRLTINRPLPSGRALQGSMVLIDSPQGADRPYSHNEYYAIETVTPDERGGCTLVFDRQTLVATRLRAAEVDPATRTISADWCNELARFEGSHSFDGRMIAAEGDANAVSIIRSYVIKKVELDSTDGFQPGQRLMVMTAKPGDVLTMPTTVTLTRSDDGRYLLRSNRRVMLTVDAPAGSRLLAIMGDDQPRTFATVDEAGRLRAELDPAELGSGQVWLQFSPAP
ncbi:MAG: heparinase [Phycisphaeraceae bacterium]|nr:heparinase [Phycisphaeraceae bacterium]